MNPNASEKFVSEIKDWQRRGFIDSETASTLSERFDRSGSFVSTVLYWLSLLGILTLALGFLGLVALTNQAINFTALLLLVAGGVSIYLGGQLSTRPEGDVGFTGASLLTIGVVLIFAGQLLLVSLNQSLDDPNTISVILILTGFIGAGVAYVYARRWPLLLGLLFFLHGCGVWGSYAGTGTYVLQIQSPKRLAGLSLGLIAVGILHERKIQSEEWLRLIGFGHHYVVLGLVYLNVSLWILSFPELIDSHTPLDEVAWILCFTVASILQLIYGASRNDSRFIGFGIIFLAINCYTRYYEFFWDRLSLGLFLLLGGIGLVVLGVYFERRHQQASYTETSPNP